MARAANAKNAQQDGGGETYNMEKGASNDDPNVIGSMLEAEVDVADAPPPDPLPKGEYTAEVNTAEVKVSQKGNRYVDVTFYISPDEYPADFTEGNPQGTNLHYRRIDASVNPLSGKLTPRAAYNIGKFMKTIGLHGGKSINVMEWAGQKARVKVDHEPSVNDRDLMLPVIVAVNPA